MATPRVSKHRLFAWVVPPVVCDGQLVVIARADDTTFGILHSRFHELWSLRMGTSLEDRPCYTPTTTFASAPGDLELGVGHDHHWHDENRARADGRRVLQMAEALSAL